jgi:hypothetical protein
MSLESQLCGPICARLLEQVPITWMHAATGVCNLVLAIYNSRGDTSSIMFVLLAGRHLHFCCSSSASVSSNGVAGQQYQFSGVNTHNAVVRLRVCVWAGITVGLPTH